MESAPPGMWEITPAAIILIIIVGVVLGSRIPGDSLDLCAAGPFSAPVEAARGWAAWCLSSLAPCRDELAPRPSLSLRSGLTSRLQPLLACPLPSCLRLDLGFLPFGIFSSTAWAFAISSCSIRSLCLSVLLFSLTSWL